MNFSFACQAQWPVTSVMNGFILSILVLSLASNSIGATQSSTVNCGPSGSFSMAGSTTVSSVAQAWAGTYENSCGNSITVQGGDDTSGARRVCGVTSAGSTVDVGLLSRELTSSEAVPVKTNTAGSIGYTYQCAQGIKTRKVIQVDAAIDGAAFVAVRNGVAANCIANLPGGGLTVGQLRWIYSNYTLAQLRATGLPHTDIPHSDRNDNTHYWSELCNTRNANNTCAQYCPATEIKFAGSPPGSSLYDFVVNKLLLDAANGEGIATNRHYFSDQSNNPANELVFLESNIEAIGYFGFAYFFSLGSNIFIIPLQSGTSDLGYNMPTEDTISSGAYAMERRLTMEVRSDDATTLALLQGFFEFAYSSQGNALVKGTGLIPIPELDQILMLSRLNATGGVDLTTVVCGPPGPILIRGSATVYPVAKVWGFIYNAACNNSLSVEQGPSTVGAESVCKWPGNHYVDIGDMSRPFKSTEAVVQSDTFTYKCLSPGDPIHTVRQLPVAIDGLTVSFAINSVAANCIASLKGLTVDQLRWMYSSFTRAQLIATGWDPNSVPNSDGNDNTHFWSELGGNNCPATEIRIAGSPSTSGTYEFFTTVVLKSQATGETIATNRPTGYFNVPQDNPNLVVQYLLLYNSAVGFFGYAYYAANNSTVGAAPIENDKGTYVSPDPTVIADDTYNPFSRRIFMNLNTAFLSLEKTAPFVTFGFTVKGDALVRATGLSPIPSSVKTLYINQRLTVTPPSCFSANNKVIVRNKGIMLLRDVKLGDYVLNAYGQYDQVYSWAHYAPDMADGLFLKIQVAGLTEPLELSPDHMLFVLAEEKGPRGLKVVPASSLVKGDQVKVVGRYDEVAVVESIQRVVRQGAFAPFTMSGTIAVSNIACSVYVDLQNGNPPGVLVLGGHPTPISSQFASHVLLSSQRIICRLSSFCQTETRDDRGISTWLATPIAIAEWWIRHPQQQSKPVAFTLFVITFALALVMYCVEQVLAARGLWVLFLIASCTFFRLRRRSVDVMVSNKKGV